MAEHDPIRYLPTEDWMTPEEMEAWDAIAAAARAMFRMTPIHPADNAETARDVHNLQNRLLARAAYDRSQRSPPAGGARAQPGC